MINSVVSLLMSKCKSIQEIEDTIIKLESKGIPLDWEPIEEAPLGKKIIVRDDNKMIDTTIFYIGTETKNSGYTEYLWSEKIY